jgi:transcription elongation factor Elf1
MTAKETMKLALHALESADWYIDQLEMLVYSVDDDGTHENRAKVQVAITAIKEALAQPEQEPVAWPMEEQPDGTVIPVDPSEMSGDLVLRLLATPPAATQSEQEPVVCKRCIELESLCDATYVAQGADAYNRACDEMERWQKQRKKSGKDEGTTGSPRAGIAWLYGHIEELEAELYTHPPQRKPLTKKRIRQIGAQNTHRVTGSELVYFYTVARAIEAAHGIKEGA